jgi:hypothetical protein
MTKCSKLYVHSYTGKLPLILQKPPIMSLKTTVDEILTVFPDTNKEIQMFLKNNSVDRRNGLNPRNIFTFSIKKRRRTYERIGCQQRRAN